MTSSDDDDAAGRAAASTSTTVKPPTSKKKKDRRGGGGTFAVRRTVTRVVATFKGQRFEGEGHNLRAAKLVIARQMGVPLS